VIRGLLEEQAERAPDAVAVVYEGQGLSEGFSARADRLVHYLRELGVGPDTWVGIRAECSLEMVVGLLAVLKAGGAYVPLDQQYQPERLEYMLQDAAPRVVLAHASVLQGVHGSGC
jgi:non-ribosomal peptide synthetase component F